MFKELSQAIVEAACEVHKRLGGPGLLETIYESALMGIQYGMLINFGKENIKDGINFLVNKQNSVPVACA